MIRWLMAVFLLWAIHAPAADWKPTLSDSKPGNFPPPRPVTATYQFGWSALSAAQGRMVFSRPDPAQIKLDLTVKTTGTVRSLFRLDSQQSALARTATLRPVRGDQKEIYADETIQTVLAFDAKGVARRRKSEPAVPGNGKVKRFDFQPLHDLQSALLYIRSQPLQQGQVYRLVIYPSTSPYLAEFAVSGRQKLKVAGRSYEAIRLDLKLQKINSKTLATTPFKKFKRASVWISDDRDRLLLRAEAEVFVGKVWAELQAATFAP